MHRAPPQGVSLAVLSSHFSSDAEEAAAASVEVCVLLPGADGTGPV